MDLVGPINESLFGNKYFLTILDDFSRFGWVFFLESKNDVFDKFLVWAKTIFNMFNKSIIFLRSDNGTEFKNNRFKSFCTNHGITQQFTVPHNPQQNGRAERFNGTLISSAKALLNDARLSHQFWECAVDTANYIHNRISHSGINNKIPFEVLFKSKVDYSQFKVFGCKVFFYVPKCFRNKFENNALPGIFLGYHPLSSAYKILNLETNKIILSRSVEFFEDNPADSKLISRIPNTFSNFIPSSEIRGSGKYFNTNNFNNSNLYNRITLSPIELNNKINKVSNTYSDQTITEHNDNDKNKNITNSESTPSTSFLTIYDNDRNKRKNEDNTVNTSIKKTKLEKTINKNFNEPQNYKDIFNLPDKDEWMNAIKEEINNMKNLNVFQTVNNIPKKANLISCKWVFKYKRDENGNITKRKARLVARGFSQRFGIDYSNTFSPTLKQESLRIIVALAVQRNFEIYFKLTSTQLT